MSQVLRAKWYIVLFTGVLSISFAAIFIRLAEAPPLVIATYRLSIASLVLIFIRLTRRTKYHVELSKFNVLSFVLSGIFLALHFGLWITSLSYTSIASSVILVTSHPAFVAVISYFLWGERLGKLKVSGIVLALLGIVTINLGNFGVDSQALLGDALALGAALSMGCYLIIGSQLRTRIDLLSYLTIIYSIAAVILLIATIISGHPLSGFSTVTYAMMILLALIPQLIGHSCLNMALRLMPATIVSVAILGEPIGATLLGWIVLHEVPGANEILGGFIVLAGIFMVVKNSKQQR